MNNEQDIIFWLFDQLVNQLEQTDEQERWVQRMEIIREKSLDLILKNGDSYQIFVKGSTTAGRIIESDLLAKGMRGEIQVPIDDWNELVDRCRAVYNFLTYDLSKMREVAPSTFHFPWDRRERMVEQLMDDLREALLRIEYRRK